MYTSLTLACCLPQNDVSYSINKCNVQLKSVNWKVQVTVKPQYRSEITDCFTFLCGLENRETETERDPPEVS